MLPLTRLGLFFHSKLLICTGAVLLLKHVPSFLAKTPICFSATEPPFWNLYTSSILKNILCFCHAWIQNDITLFSFSNKPEIFDVCMILWIRCKFCINTVLWKVPNSDWEQASPAVPMFTAPAADAGSKALNSSLPGQVDIVEQSGLGWCCEKTKRGTDKTEPFLL